MSRNGEISITDGHTEDIKPGRSSLEHLFFDPAEQHGTESVASHARIVEHGKPVNPVGSIEVDIKAQELRTSKLTARSVQGDEVKTVPLYPETVSEPGTPPFGLRRRRQLTEKGQSFMLECKQRQIVQLFRQMDRCSETIYKLMDSNASTREVKTVFAQWMSLYEQLIARYDETCDLNINPDMLVDFEASYEAKHEPLVVCREEVKQWFINQGIREQSYRAKSTRSHARSVSSHNASHKTRSSSLFSAKVREEQRQAELLARQEALKEKQTLELSKIKIQQMEENLAIKTELDVVKARSRVLTLYEDDHSSQRIDVTKPIPAKTFHPSGEQITFKQDNDSSKLSQASKVYERSAQTVLHQGLDFEVHQPKLPQIAHLDTSHQDILQSETRKIPQSLKSHGSNDSGSHSLVEEVIRSVVRQLKKPPTDIIKFNGDPLTYKRFVRQFETRIVPNTEDDDERLTYLDQYTTGEPNKIVQSISYLDSSAAYPAIWKELNERYGDNDVIATTFINKALQWPTLRPNDAKGLNEFSIFLCECQHAVAALESLRILEYPDNIKKLLGKLPPYMHERWRNIVELCKEKSRIPLFSDLVSFVKLEARKANHPIYGKDAMIVNSADKKSFGSKNRSSAAVSAKPGSLTKMKVPKVPEESTNASSNVKVESNVKTELTAFSTPCLHCSKSHPLASCDAFRDETFKDRIQFLRSKGFCFGCLKSGHIKPNCKNKAACDFCKYRHPSVLHISSVSSDSNSKPSSMVSPPLVMANPQNMALSSASTNMVKDTTFAIVPVRVRMKNCSTEVCTYAFLDCGSNVSFCTEGLMRSVCGNTQHRKMKLTMETMGNPYTMKTFSVKDLEISSLDRQHTIQLPEVYTKDSIPASTKHIPTEQDIQCWPHLNGVTVPKMNATIDLLIGNDIADAYTPLEVKTGPSGSPHATKTRLGWIVWNLVRPDSETELTVNRAEARFIQQHEFDHSLDLKMTQLFNTDFPERVVDDRPEPSENDRKFLNKIDKSLQLMDGHYEMCLPFRHDQVHLPSNQKQVLASQNNLKKKLSLDPKLHQQYTDFMENLVKQGYAEPVPENELISPPHKVWYIPHHGVIHPTKGKLRVVFDCAATYGGVSLNQLLLQGPDLTSSLIGVLLKFRQHPIAINADIEKMFYQVRVSKENVDFLRYFWWPGGNLDKDAKAYRMLVHLFGAVSSPACANIALRQTAEDNRSKFPSEVCDVINTNFYVDDLLMSVPTENEAVSLVHDVSNLCMLGGFHLTEWSSNKRDVLRQIPENELAKNLKGLDLNDSQLPEDRVLGIRWYPESDHFGFKVISKEISVPTRRSLLSVTSSVFDPLGFISPFILKAKLLQQELCKLGLSWDEPIEGTHLDRWRKWEKELEMLNKFKVPRCLIPENYPGELEIELHHFADASDHGYGVVSYARFLHEDGQANCHLLMSRARVNPIKKVTVPRLELTACTTAVRLDNMIQQHMKNYFVKTYYWTDSMSVLRYIWNETSRFPTFVSNRLAVIKEATKKSQWKYVPSAKNPADIVSRGMSSANLVTSDQWLNGPSFLHVSESQWPQLPTLDISEQAEKVSTNASMSAELCVPAVTKLLEYFSDWSKLVKSVGWILLFKAYLMSRCTKKHSKDNTVQKALTPSLLEKAEIAICSYEQKRFMKDEIKDIIDGPSKKISASLQKLDPLYVDGLLRVGGRLERASIPFSAKHPVIVPSTSAISDLILTHYHRKLGHLGRNSILSETRQKFWIVKAGTKIKKLLSKCIICRKYRLKTLEQKMASLPFDRTVIGEPAFSRVGVDYFGPLYVRRGRTTVKRYGVLFTCMLTRAIHLELSSSLDTNSCINAIRRFVCRRGPVKVFWSDNGTNLVGAQKELKLGIQNWNQSKLHSVMLQEGIEWNFNPPSASHFGGIWERMILSARKILYGLLQEQPVVLDDDQLSTLLCEVECILNSRPITRMSNDVSDLQPLTPNHLLKLKPGPHESPDIFKKNDLYVRQHWRKIQFMADMFWSRWVKEYLSSLQERSKWFHPSRSVKIGDVVLIMENAIRNSWTLGRITKVIEDKKGLVRIVELKTATSVLTRPIHKLCMLLEADSP